MSEVYSDWQDCSEISKMLFEKLGNRYDLKISLYVGVINGKLFDGEEKYDWCKVVSHDYVPFSVKYNKEYFLRIGVNDNTWNKSTSMGHKLAALSTLYEVLYPKFGNPDVFYIADDDENTMAFQWCFKDKEKEIEKFKNDTEFDDANIVSLKLIKQNNTELEEISRRKIGLPIELTDLIDENIDEYVLYKNGREITVLENTYIDSVKVTSIKKKKELVNNRKK